MTYGVDKPERRRLGLKAPITGALLVGLVVWGGYTGYQRAFGGGTSETAAPAGCPTTTVTSATPTTPTTAPTDAAAAPLTTTPTTVPPTTAPAVPTTGAYLLPAQVTVNVYNATNRRGLAINTAALLKDRGFTIDEVTNDPLEEVIPEIAKIRASSATMPEVQLLIQYVPGAIVVADGRAGSTVDLVLGEAFTTVGDAATVTPVPIPTARC